MYNSHPSSTIIPPFSFLGSRVRFSLPSLSFSNTVTLLFLHSTVWPRPVTTVATLSFTCVKSIFALGGWTLLASKVWKTLVTKWEEQSYLPSRHDSEQEERRASCLESWCSRVYFVMCVYVCVAPIGTRDAVQYRVAQKCVRIGVLLGRLSTS